MPMLFGPRRRTPSALARADQALLARRALRARVREAVAEDAGDREPALPQSSSAALDVPAP